MSGDAGGPAVPQGAAGRTMTGRVSSWTCVRQLTSADGLAVAGLLDAAVGEGFHDVAAADQRLSFVGEDAAGLAGVILATLSPYEELRDFYAVPGRLPDFALVPAPGTVAHVRELAVAPRARRAGLATALLARAEKAAAGLGAQVLLLNAWLPAGEPTPASVPFYQSNGYRAAGDIVGFFAAPDVTPGAACPFCGPPPCRCAVRVFVKDLRR